MGYNIYFLLTMGILESKIKTIKLHKKSFKLTVLVRWWYIYQGLNLQCGGTQCKS